MCISMINYDYICIYNPHDIPMLSVASQQGFGIPRSFNHLHALWQHEAVRRLHRSLEAYSAAGQVFGYVDASSFSKILEAMEDFRSCSVGNLSMIIVIIVIKE